MVTDRRLQCKEVQLASGSRVGEIALVVLIKEAEASVVDADHHLVAEMGPLRVDRLPQPAHHAGISEVERGGGGERERDK